METEAMIKIAELDFNLFESRIAENPELITTKDTNDRFLIHWAALKGKERAVEHLLSFKQCPLDVGDDTDATPLILATLNGNHNIVQSLLEKGADINHKNWQGHSPLQYACSKGWQDIVRLLLEKGADVDAQDKRGDSSLHRLVSLGRTEILNIILERKPNLNCVNAEGNTPVHIACEDDQSSCALQLIAHGADVNIPNKAKELPVDLCKSSGLRRSIKEKMGIVDL